MPTDPTPRSESVGPTPRPGRAHIPFSMRLAVTLWAAMLVVVTVRVAIVRPTSGSVFPVYTTAAEAWVAGDDLYTLDFSKPCYRYHPLVAASFVPWSAFPPKLAAVLWRWLGVALLLGGLIAWRRRLDLRRLSPAWFGWLLVLMVPLALQSVNNAQVNVHLLGLLLFGLAAAALERWTLAAVLIAAATVLKVYPIAAGLLLASLYPRQFGPRFALALLAAFAAPYLAQSADYVTGQYRLWFEYLRVDDRHAAALDEAPRDFYLLLRVWLVAPAESMYRLLQLAAAGLCACCLRRMQARGATRNETLSATLHLGAVWMTLFGPSTESSTYTLLGVTAAAALVPLHPHTSRGARLVAVLGYTLLTLPVFAAVFPGGKVVQHWGLQPAGALCLLTLLLRRAWLPSHECQGRLLTQRTPICSAY